MKNKPRRQPALLHVRRHRARKCWCVLQVKRRKKKSRHDTTQCVCVCRERETDKALRQTRSVSLCGLLVSCLECVPPSCVKVLDRERTRLVCVQCQQQQQRQQQSPATEEEEEEEECTHVVQQQQPRAQFTHAVLVVSAKTTNVWTRESRCASSRQ